MGRSIFPEKVIGVPIKPDASVTAAVIAVKEQPADIKAFEVQAITTTAAAAAMPTGAIPAKAEPAAEMEPREPTVDVSIGIAGAVGLADQPRLWAVVLSVNLH